MYDKCYFCLDQLPKLKKGIHSKIFRKFWRSRGTKEPAYITVFVEQFALCGDLVFSAKRIDRGPLLLFLYDFFLGSIFCKKRILNLMSWHTALEGPLG